MLQDVPLPKSACETRQRHRVDDHDRVTPDRFHGIDCRRPPPPASNAGDRPGTARLVGDGLGGFP